MGLTKVLPNDVLEVLEGTYDGHATRKQLALSIGCSIGTISRKIAVLIVGGENIGFDRSGVFIQHKEDMTDKKKVDRADAWRGRIIASLVMWAKRGNNHKPIAIEARKQFAKKLTTDERKLLKANLLLITRVVDAVDLDEELG